MRVSVQSKSTVFGRRDIASHPGSTADAQGNFANESGEYWKAAFHPVKNYTCTGTESLPGNSHIDLAI